MPVVRRKAPLSVIDIRGNQNEVSDISGLHGSRLHAGLPPIFAAVNCSSRNRIVPEGMGVNIHFFDHEPGMDALKSLDMRWLRMDITWDRVEREKGVYDFSQVDKLMNDAKARGLRVLAIIDYANKLYEPEQKVISEAGAGPTPPMPPRWCGVTPGMT